jgi:tetratricopeptide (TPR) repeat protein
MDMPARRAHVSCMMVVILAGMAAGQAAEPPAASQRQALVAGWLNRYAEGDVDAARAFASQRDRLQAVRAFPDQARKWIESDPRELVNRRLTAATFVIDAVRHWAGSEDWQYARPLIAWGCAELGAAGPPTAAERIWHLAAVAVLESADDWPFLLGQVIKDGRPFKTMKDPLLNDLRQGHLSHAVARFPNEARFSLASAVAVENLTWSIGGFGRDSNLRSGLFAGEIDPGYQTRLRDGALVADDGSNKPIPGVKFLARSHLTRIDEVRRLRDQYQALTRQPSVAAEAHVRLALLAIRFAEPDVALRHIGQAQSLAHEPYVVFLSYLFTGAVHERQGQDDEAIGAYRSALNVFPRAQSATSLLATRLFGLGRQSEAAALADDFFKFYPGDLAGDPWCTYRLGDYRLLPTYLAQLRAAIN